MKNRLHFLSLHDLMYNWISLRVDSLNFKILRNDYMVLRYIFPIGLILSAFFLALSFSTALAEEQPIAFSHKLHTVQNGIACQYCHLYARRSFSSGVPPVSTCIGCHVHKNKNWFNQKVQRSIKYGLSGRIMSLFHGLKFMTYQILFDFLTKNI